MCKSIPQPSFKKRPEPAARSLATQTACWPHLLGVCLLLLLIDAGCSSEPATTFTRLMTRGNAFLERQESAAAISTYEQALQLEPNSIDARVNLAIAHLQHQDPAQAIAQCNEVLALDSGNAAAFYLLGCAHARLNQFEAALQAFQQSQRLDPRVTALNYQLGRVYHQLGHVEEAVSEFELAVQFEPAHRSAHYQLSRLYATLGREEEATRAMAQHQALLAETQAPPADPAFFEQCKHTQPRAPLTVQLPDSEGIPVTFVTRTNTASARWTGALAVMRQRGPGPHLLLAADGGTIQPLQWDGNQFAPMGDPLPGNSEGSFRRILVGDLDNDHYDDVIALGPDAIRVARFGSDGRPYEVTETSGLQNARGSDGVLADLDFTGRLDLLCVTPDGQGLRVHQNRGGMFFMEATATSGLPGECPGAEQVTLLDWFNADLPAVFVARDQGPSVLFPKERAGQFQPAPDSPVFPSAQAVAAGDYDNDLRMDVALASSDGLHLVFGGSREPTSIPMTDGAATTLLAVDYDNDGWLDLVRAGDSLRVWRNLGGGEFKETTSEVRCSSGGAVRSIVAADIDDDGDTDLVLTTGSGLRLLENNGGNANGQLKLQLAGNRSNASALGVQVELTSGQWRTLRMQGQGPLEIGVGTHNSLDQLKVRWFDTTSTLVDVPVRPEPLPIDETETPTGSCPYLYIWDGVRFRFVTDLLGASPLGLPVSKTRFIDADTEEYVALGTDADFPPRHGAYEVRITEELREVLYLDQARLVAVDHPEDTRVLSTSKLRPGKPFPPAELWTLKPVASLRQATRSDGLDVTSALATTDRRMVSPVNCREPQLRGLAEPYAVEMDFGKLPVDLPLVLVLNGWLQFGGGMANVAASLDATLPFPFPSLEAQLPDGTWQAVDTVVGAPAGKTKTILVDLAGVLPEGAQRLRLTTAFEIHWDSASLCERVHGMPSHVREVPIQQAELQWRGFSEYQALPDDQPLSPDYERTHSTPPWRIAVSGWCTRYGPVEELVAAKDNALVLLNAGDELALRFDGESLPPCEPGFVRDLFLYTVGWDKDADFHVAQGWRVEPLPWHGMNDQAYGHEERPADLDETWIERYNTRWIGPKVLKLAQP